MNVLFINYVDESSACQAHLPGFIVWIK